VRESNIMSDTTKKLVAEAVEKATEGLDKAEEQVTLAKWEYDLLLAKAAKSEKKVLSRVVDAVVSHKHQILLGTTTVLLLGAAAVAVKNKDTIIGGLEQATEEAAETVELGAQAVKKDARKARTGSTTK
jgi:hypothetical protein